MPCGFGFLFSVNISLYRTLQNEGTPTTTVTWSLFARNDFLHQSKVHGFSSVSTVLEALVLAASLCR